MGWTESNSEVIDGNGTENTTTYGHNADGSLAWSMVNGNESTKISLLYDDAGNRKELTDPNYGTVTDHYNAFGQLDYTISPKGDVTAYMYDNLGRMKTRTETCHSNPSNLQRITTWSYSETPGKKGLLEGIELKEGEIATQTIAYAYDMQRYNRLASKTETLHGTPYTTTYAHDDPSGHPLRLKATTYPTGYTMTRDYDALTGRLRQLKHGSTVLWTTESMNALGQITRYTTGDGAETDIAYDDRHLLKRQVTRVANQNNLQDFGYIYDIFANLATRKDNIRNLEERFTYDNLNRLETIALNGGTPDRIEYDAFGRILSKQADGNMVFDNPVYDDANKPHAIRSAQTYGDPFPTAQQNITYTLFDKVKTITQSCNGQQQSLVYTYGYDRQRIHMEEKLGNYTLREKRYGDHCEIVTENRHTVSRTFLTGPMGVFAVVEHNGEDDELHYVYKDHLGSWTTITNAGGVVEREQSFDAWGNMRDPETWSCDYNNTPMFDRGFTGHEHLHMFGLINMNGRVYDPVMSTFLSPDNYVQAPDNSQNFNRYAYCLNNPLKYTDPSGESIVLAAVVGAFWGAAFSMAMNFDNIRTDADFVNTLTLGALGGAVGGAAGFAASSAVAGVLGTTGAIPGFVTSASGGFAGGFAGTSVTSWCTGSTFGDGLWAGLKAGAIGGLTAGLIGAHNGAMDAINAGGEMWWGDGASFDQISAVTISGEPVNYDQTTAEQFSKESFGDDISGLRNLYADGRVPPENNRFIWVKKPDGSVHVYEKIDGQLKWLGRTNGTTRYISNRFIRKSDVYLYETAFCSKEQLYLTMGHEYIHCGFNIDKSLGNPTLDQTRNIQEASCYQWEINQARAWSYEKYATHMEGIYNEIYKGYLNPRYQPSISIISIRPWLK